MIRPDVLVEIFQEFDDEEKKLPKDVRKQLTDILNKLVQDIRKKGWIHKFFKPQGAIYPEHIKKRKYSSLYLFKAMPTLYIVLTFDDDFINNQKVLGLFKIADSEHKLEAYNYIASHLY